MEWEEVRARTREWYSVAKMNSNRKCNWLPNLVARAAHFRGLATLYWDSARNSGAPILFLSTLLLLWVADLDTNTISVCILRATTRQIATHSYHVRIVHLKLEAEAEAWTSGGNAKVQNTHQFRRPADFSPHAAARSPNVIDTFSSEEKNTA